MNPVLFIIFLILVLSVILIFISVNAINHPIPLVSLSANFGLIFGCTSFVFGLIALGGVVVFATGT